jgi:hypothetical protein
MSNVTNGCPEFEADLSALLDGELPPERAAQVRAHAETCERCGAQLARLVRLDGLLAGAPAPAVPDSLRARLEARIAAAEAGAGAGLPDTRLRDGAGVRAPRRAWRSRVAGAVAAAAAAIAIYLALANREPAIPGAPPAPVQVARPQAEPAPAAPQIAKRDAPAPVAAKVIARRPEPEAPAPAPAPIDLEAVPDEDLGIALELETVEDFEEIANLELLELMLANEAG